MRENRLSGLEGWVRSIPHPYPYHNENCWQEAVILANMLHFNYSSRFLPDTA